jgi:hypothetical protein
VTTTSGELRNERREKAGTGDLQQLVPTAVDASALFPLGCVPIARINDIVNGCPQGSYNIRCQGYRLHDEFRTHLGDRCACSGSTAETVSLLLMNITGEGDKPRDLLTVNKFLSTGPIQPGTSHALMRLANIALNLGNVPPDVYTFGFNVDQQRLSRDKVLKQTVEVCIGNNPGVVEESGYKPADFSRPLPR